MAYKKTPIWGHFIGMDTTSTTEAARRIPMYKRDSNGAPAAITLAATDIVEINSIQALGAGAGTIIVYDGSDATVGAGESFWIHRPATAGGGSLYGMEFKIPHLCQPGTYPKMVVTGLSTYDCWFKGYLWELIS